MTDGERYAPPPDDRWDPWGGFEATVNSPRPEPVIDPEAAREILEARRAARLAEETERELIRLRARRAAEKQFAAEEAEEAKREAANSSRVHDGATFLLDLPATPPAIWGKGDDVIWSRDESLVIVGPQGVGKTTLAGQLLRALVGLQPEVLGFPVQCVDARVGYLAMDRPEQARRALGRMFAEEERSYIAEMLRFWSGPLPSDAAVDPEIFVRIASRLGAEVLFVDSLKDAAIGLSKDEVGAGYNRARQFALAEGIQMVELHHVVKNGADGKAPRNLAGVYGSTWLTSGAGSVVMLWGEAGDPIVELNHLKQPINEIGPFKIRHNRETGLCEVFHDESTDVIALARRAPTGGLSAQDVACCLFSTEKPSTAQLEKARRRLDRFVADGLLVQRGDGGRGRGNAARWYPAAPSRWFEGVEEAS